MKWFQAFPYPTPEDRAYVVWRPSQVLRVATDISLGPSRYGLMLKEMARLAPEGFCMLEWDIVLDLDDMAIMEAAIRWQPESIHVAAYPLWWKPEGAMALQWNQPYQPGSKNTHYSRSVLADEHVAGLGCIYFPPWVLGALDGHWKEIQYPTAESNLWALVGSDRIHVVDDIKPKHIHW